MNPLSRSLLYAALLPLSVSAVFADTSLTIYNQSFAVVRDSVPLDLQQGENRIHFTEATTIRGKPQRAPAAVSRVPSHHRSDWRVP